MSEKIIIRTENPKSQEERRQMKLVLDMLNDVKFPVKKPYKDNTRSNITGGKKMDIKAIVLGKVRSYSESNLVESSKNKRYPELFIALKKLIKLHNPNYRWNSVIINKNLKTSWHRDKGNKGMSYGIGLGNFTGGGISFRIAGKIRPMNNHNKWLYFDGNNIEHSSTAFKGTRYAIIYYWKK